MPAGPSGIAVDVIILSPHSARQRGASAVRTRINKHKSRAARNQPRTHRQTQRSRTQSRVYVGRLCCCILSSFCLRNSVIGIITRLSATPLNPSIARSRDHPARTAAARLGGSLERTRCLNSCAERLYISLPPLLVGLVNVSLPLSRSRTTRLPCDSRVSLRLDDLDDHRRAPLDTIIKCCVFRYFDTSRDAPRPSPARRSSTACFFKLSGVCYTDKATIESA